MLGIASRLIQAQQAASPVPHLDDEHRIAGRQAEEKVQELLRTVGGVTSSDMFPALRVPDQFQTRRHEIDLLVVTGYGIYCIEIKNWGGKITASKDSKHWEQRKTLGESNFKQIQYINPVAETKQKANILCNHFLRAGICLTENKFITRVVMTNKSCDVDDSIKKDPCVILEENLMNFVSSFNRSYTAMLTDPLIPYFLRGQLSYSQMDQVRCALGQIGTWDILDLNGGRRLIGDYKGCTELSINRKEVEELMFAHQRNATTATFWAVVGYAPTVPVTMYKRGGMGWFTRETTGTVTLPYNKDIAFRIVGETEDAKIPANDIKTIVLSN